MESISSFGEMLKMFRTRKHLTRQTLATLVGVHRNTISIWERGDYLPESKTLVLEVARQLGLAEQETRQLLEASLTALSPYWHVPFPRNPFFTGREATLETLHTYLHADHMVALTQSYALHGLGGVGKTQVALEYAYRHALDYGAIFWIRAETVESIVSSLLRIAEVLQLPGRDEKNQQHVVEAVQQWLTTHKQWLLIWDNVEDLGTVDRFLSSARQGAILLTTRRLVLGTLMRGMDLLPMEQEEGMLFLLRRAKVVEPAATREQVSQLTLRISPRYATASELVKDLGGLPLALDQAGAYLEETQCSLSAYLELFHARRAALLQQRGEGSRDHPASVSTTFTLAITETARHHPAVLDLLRVCALLQPDAIPEELFRQKSEHLGIVLERACCDDLEWNRLVAIACSYSLLSRQPEEQALSMHRLVQAVLLDAMTEEEREQWTRRAVAALDAAFPEVQPSTEYATWEQYEQLLPHALLCLQRADAADESLVLASLAYEVLNAVFPGVVPSTEYAAWERCERLLPHALLCLQRIDTADESLALASLAYRVAQYLRMRGRYTEAEPLLQRALQIWEQAQGPGHPDVARVLNNLAVLYWSQGRYAEAEPLYQRALRIREQTLGPDHLDVAISLNNLALLYWSQGRYAEAEPLYQRALRIREQGQGPDHPDVATSLNNLATLYLERGRYAEAEPLYRRTLQIREQTLGYDHPEVAQALNNLALLSRGQGRGAEAEPLYRQALHILEQALGSDHPEVAQALNNLADLAREQGNYAEAESLYQRALRITEQNLGSEHPDLASSLNGLADLAREQGNYAEAESLYQRALTFREQHLGQQHPETAQTLHDLALLRQKQGHLYEALSLAERTLKIRSRFLGDAHPKTVATRTLYAQLVQE